MAVTALQSLIRYLEQEYYLPAKQSCQRVAECITEIHKGDDDQTASLYTSLCKKLIEQVGYYLSLRREFLQPYLSDEPGEEICDAYCASQLEAAERRIQDLLTQLRAIVAPVPHRVTEPDWEKLLHQEIRKLAERLTEMFYLERTALVETVARSGA
jgi:hypothetical protein